MAKLNKPVIAVGHGHAFNSGATLLQASGIPTAAPNTKVAFNEVTFGFVPHGGSSYYLSRMPGELGAFLALTGLPISGLDAVQNGMADMYIHKADSYRYLLGDIIDNIEFPMPSGFNYADQERHLRQKLNSTKGTYLEY